MWTRWISWLLSIALHGAAVLLVVMPAGNAALEAGTGDDTLVVENGIAVEGFAQIGDAAETVEAVEAPPVISQAQPEIREVEKVEEEKDEIVTSELGPEQEFVDEPKPEVLEEPPLPPQIATIEQTEVAIEEQRAAGLSKSGGETTASSAYLGKLRSHLEKNKVNPRSRIAGTVTIRFSVGAAGELLGHEVSKSSGSQVLDQAAMASIERAAPFPAMADAGSGPVVVSVPFKFSVR